MPADDAIEGTDPPLTVDSLAEHLRSCGVKPGQTVLVHTAMSRLGWVIGGAEAVILALLHAVGASGTILMPAHSAANTDPKDWQHPPVAERWWQTVREHTPAFDVRTTPTRSMGAVPELFRCWPGALRSNHPAFSLAAYGANAAYLVAGHDLAEDCGDRSPLGKLYALDGHVLLLGVGHANNSSLHLAETRARFPGKRRLSTGSAMLVNGKRQWVRYESLELISDDFESLGAAFDRACSVTLHKIGDAEVRHFRQRPLVDFAVEWMERHRDFSQSATSA